MFFLVFDVVKFVVLTFPSNLTLLTECHPKLFCNKKFYNVTISKLNDNLNPSKKENFAQEKKLSDTK
jgi:hypothetical protein